MFPLRCANTQDHQNCCTVKSRSRALATFQSNGNSTENKELFEWIFLSHSKTIHAKVASFLNLYTKRSNQKALQFRRVVNSLKTWKTSKGVFWYSSARPGAFARFAQWLIRPGCCRLFQMTIKNCKVPNFKSTDLSPIQVTIRPLAATYKSNSATALCWLLPPVIMM